MVFGLFRLSFYLIFCLVIVIPKCKYILELEVWLYLINYQYLEHSANTIMLSVVFDDNICMLPSDLDPVLLYTPSLGQSHDTSKQVIQTNINCRF